MRGVVPLSPPLHCALMLYTGTAFPVPVHMFSGYTVLRLLADMFVIESEVAKLNYHAG